MPTSIFFNGRLISIPGSYSEVDASGMTSLGLSAAGIVALLGTAVGGRPANTIFETKDFIRLTNPSQGRSTFKSGDLREACDMVFAPSKDPNIQGGAVEVIAMKVNPATQSTATLANATGPCLTLTSNDYGAFTGQLNVSIAAGTVAGKLVTIAFEDTVESKDNIGGTNIFTLKYANPGNGWTTMTAQVVATGEIRCQATRGLAGKDADITPLAAGLITIVSTLNVAADIGPTVRIWGITAGGVAQSETLTLNGTTIVSGTLSYAASGVWGAQIVTGAPTGTVTVNIAGGAAIMTMPTGTFSKGLYLGQCMYAAGALSAVSSGASTKRLILSGLSPTGTAQLEKITLTGVVSVAGVAIWSEIQHVIMGEVEAAQTITYSGRAANPLPAVYSTIQKVADYFNARFITAVGGFTCTLVTTMTGFLPDNLDVQTATVNCLSPVVPGFTADLWAIIDWVNTSTEYTTATRATGAKDGAPSNTAAPVFLTGGAEGVAAASHYLTALNLLKKTFVNSIVVLTGDPAIHAYLDAHCAYMCGIGRSERDGFVGVMNAGVTDVPTKVEYKAAVVNLNSRHIRAAGQSIERYNSSGVRQTFMPPFQAVILAGMQAGAEIGLSLTHKYADVLSIAQNSTWNPTDDSEEMIKAGCCFMEAIEGIGRRVVRNITTYLVDNNIAYCEASVNEAVNYSVYNFRTTMEAAVGKKGFAGTINAAKAMAIGALALLVDEDILIAFKNPIIELIVDVLDVTIEIAPVIPINFVKNTVHLVTIQQSA